MHKFSAKQKKDDDALCKVQQAKENIGGKVSLRTRPCGQGQNKELEKLAVSYHIICSLNLAHGKEASYYNDAFKSFSN